MGSRSATHASMVDEPQFRATWHSAAALFEQNVSTSAFGTGPLEQPATSMPTTPTPAPNVNHVRMISSEKANT
jgi:hypothetical protein